MITSTNNNRYVIKQHRNPEVNLDNEQARGDIDQEKLLKKPWEEPEQENSWIIDIL